MAITATRPATCPRCNKPIFPGNALEQVMAAGRKAWAHATEWCRTSEDDAEDFAESFPGDAPAKPPVPAMPRPAEAIPHSGAAADVEEMVRGECARLGKVFGSVLDEALGQINKQVAAEAQAHDETARAWLARMEEKLTALAESARTVTYSVKTATGAVHALPKGGIRHECFMKVYRLLAAGMDTLIHGPAGTGKTHLCKQLAEALPRQDGTMGRPFGFITGSPGIMERHFTGTTTPNIHTGEPVFTGTEFLDCFEKGGVFLIDEGDNMDPSVWVSLNAALANGRLSLPLRRENPIALRHPDFVLVVSANTTGGGGDRQYSSRAKLDASTIDRFAGCMVPMGYSDAIESAVCPDPALLKTLRGWRKAIADSRLDRILSTRFVARAYAFKQMGDSLERIAASLTRDAGWSKEEASLVLGAEMADRAWEEE